jgi:hypothetical protein
MIFKDCHLRAFDSAFEALSRENYCRNLTKLHITLQKGFASASEISRYKKEYPATMDKLMAMIAKNKHIQSFCLSGLHFTEERQAALFDSLRKNTSLISVGFDHLIPENKYYKPIVEVMLRNQRAQTGGEEYPATGFSLTTAPALVFEPQTSPDEAPVDLPLLELIPSSHTPERPPMLSPIAEVSDEPTGHGIKRQRSATPDSESDTHSISPSPTRKTYSRDLGQAAATAAGALASNNPKLFNRIVSGANLAYLDITEGFRYLPALLPHCSSIRILRLKCEIDDQSAIAFSQQAKTGNLALQRLVFDGCKASSLALQNIFLSLPRLQQLSRLRIRMVRADEWVETLASQLAKCNLTELCLESLQLTPALADMLGKKIARSLTITHFELGERTDGSLLAVIRQLAARHSSSPLRKLGLHWMNAVDSSAGVDGICRIVAASPDLGTLELTDNNFSESDIDRLIDAIQNAGVATRADLRQWNQLPTELQRQRLDDVLSRRIVSTSHPAGGLMETRL